MKTSKDPRHLQRIKVMQNLFANDFHTQPKTEDEIFTVTKNVLENLNKLDERIKEAAPEWPIEKINKIDLAILRLAVFELLIEQKNPPKVVIDEAVEIAKEYGGETSPSFVNGVLGKLISDHKITV